MSPEWLANHVRLEVILDRGGDVIAGTVRGGTGSGVDFMGWLEFMSAVDTLSARQSSDNNAQENPEMPTRPQKSTQEPAD